MNSDEIGLLFSRFGINTLVVSLAVFGLYYRSSRNREFCFSFMAISMIVFMLCYLLENVKLELGFALGLFAIFGILRYRTITIPIKEMTYLFMVIGVSVINALSGSGVPGVLLFLTNLVVLLVLFSLETFVMREGVMLINYEHIENLNVARRIDLRADLESRIGIRIKRFEVESVDFLRDTVMLKVFFQLNPQNRFLNDAKNLSSNDSATDISR